MISVAALHGEFWVEPNVTEAFNFLLAGAPRRDMLLLFANPTGYVEFLAETVRLALHAWPSAQRWGVPWPLFLEGVLPYAVIDEKRDLHFRWRTRYMMTLLPLVAQANSTGAAMRIIAAAIPRAATMGALGLQPASGTPADLVAGPPITWVSESSPAMLSPSQIAMFGEKEVVVVLLSRLVVKGWA